MGGPLALRITGKRVTVQTEQGGDGNERTNDVRFSIISIIAVVVATTSANFGPKVGYSWPGLVRNVWSRGLRIQSYSGG